MPRFSRPWTWPAYRRYLQRSSLPILVGPWRGEVGFEALYWLPFLAQLGIDPARLIPITRGGAAAWYGTPTGLELYAMRTPQAVRIENRLQHTRTGQLKQTHVTAFDRQVMRDAAQTLGLRRYLTLHPAWLYQTLAPFWEGASGLGWLESRVQFGPLPVPALPDGVTLPESFVCARFYARATFPPSDQTAGFVRAVLTQVAHDQPVVLLNSGLHTDDHVDYLPKTIPGVRRLSDLCAMTAENNLAIQSAVLARARGFVGTYGGLAQLALRYGKPSLSFFTEWQGTAVPHKHLSEALALQMRVPFQVLRLGDLPLLQAVLPQALNSPDVGIPAEPSPVMV